MYYSGFGGGGAEQIEQRSKAEESVRTKAPRE